MRKSPDRISFLIKSIFSAAQPTIQHLPQPLATKAAWDVIPPLAVRIASATCIPCTSSGEVSSRTNITFSPFFTHSSASSAVKTTRPTLPPGPAGNPRTTTSVLTSSSRSKLGCNNSSSCAGLTRKMPVSFSIMPSDTISTAILIAAPPVLLPVLVCSIHR